MPMPDHPDFEVDDYAVIVKMRGSAEKLWKWEITAPGHKKPVRQSTECFASMSAALRAGKEALRVFRLLPPPRHDLESNFVNATLAS
jgi:hypothetical protein